MLKISFSYFGWMKYIQNLEADFPELSENLSLISLL